jgi:hypothetical protein
MSVSDHHLKSLGRIAVNFQFVETVIVFYVCELIGPDQTVGQIVATQLPICSSWLGMWLSIRCAQGWWSDHRIGLGAVMRRCVAKRLFPSGYRPTGSGSVWRWPGGGRGVLCAFCARRGAFAQYVGPI